MKSTTVSFVNFADIANHLQLTADELDAVYDYGFSNVSWGDATYTLIGNDYALRCIVNALMTHYDELNDNDGDIPSRSIPDRILTEDEVCTKFWEMVEQWDYVNLEN